MYSHVESFATSNNNNLPIIILQQYFMGNLFQATGTAILQNRGGFLEKKNDLEEKFESFFWGPRLRFSHTLADII